MCSRVASDTSLWMSHPHSGCSDASNRAWASQSASASPPPGQHWQTLQLWGHPQLGGTFPAWDNPAMLSLPTLPCLCPCLMRHFPLSWRKRHSRSHPGSMKNKIIKLFFFCLLVETALLEIFGANDMHVLCSHGKLP